MTKPLTEQQSAAVGAFVEAMRDNPNAVTAALASSMRPEDIAAIAAATSNEARTLLRTQGAIEALSEVAGIMSGIAVEAQKNGDDHLGQAFSRFADSVMARISSPQNPEQLVTVADAGVKIVGGKGVH